jgi:hypothetical protein
MMYLNILYGFREAEYFIWRSNSWGTNNVTIHAVLYNITFSLSLLNFLIKNLFDWFHLFVNFGN